MCSSDLLEPNDMERVVIFSFLLDFAHESRFKRRKKILGGGEIIGLVVLIVEKGLLGAESLGGRDGVSGVTLDDIRHRRFTFGIGEVSDSIHPTIGEMVPDSVLKIDEAAGLLELSRYAGTTEVVPLLRGGGMDRAELIW